MASISSFIVASNQNAAPVAGKATRGSKQNQRATTSFGEMLNQTLTTAEGAPEKAGAKTAGKSVKVDAHRIKAHARKDDSEASPATAPTSPQMSSVLDDMVAARSASEARPKATAETASAEKPQLRTVSAAADLHAIAGARTAADPHAIAGARTAADPHAIAGARTATDTHATTSAKDAAANPNTTAAAFAGAPDATSVNENTIASDILEVAQATPAHPEHGRMTPQTTDSAAGKAAGKAAETVAGQTAGQNEARTTDPQVKRGNTQTLLEAETVERPEGLAKSDKIPQGRPVNRPTQESALRQTDNAATVQRAAPDGAGKTATATETGNFKLATEAFGVAPHGPVQAASNTSAPTPASLTLTPRIASDEWNNALGKHVVWMAHANQQVAELHLNPQDLGPLKVTLIMNDNHAQVMFASSHQPVLAAVEAALPQLRTTLAESGISLGNTSVGPESQQQQGMLAQDQSSQSGQPGQRGYRGDDTGIAQAAASIAAPASPAVIRSNGGAIDTFA